MAAVPGGGKYIYIYISPILCKKGTPTKQQFYRRSKKQTFKKLSSLLQTKYLSYQNNITHTHTHIYIYATNQNFGYSLLDGGVPAVLFHRKELSATGKKAGWVTETVSMGWGREFPYRIENRPPAVITKFDKNLFSKACVSVIKRH